MDEIKSFCISSRRGFRDFTQMNKDIRTMFKEVAIDLLEKEEGLKKICEDIVKFSSVRISGNVFHESSRVYFPSSFLIHSSLRGRSLSSIYSDTYTTEHSLYEFPHPYQLVQQLNFLVKILRNRLGLSLDLFCGSGIDLLGLASISDNIIGVDIEKDSVSLARINAKRFSSISNITILQEDALKIIHKIDVTPDLIYLDPEWNGPDYKKKLDIPLYIGNKELSEFCDELIKKYPRARLYVKFPRNYQFWRVDHISFQFQTIFKKDGVEVSYYVGIY